MDRPQYINYNRHSYLLCPTYLETLHLWGSRKSENAHEGYREPCPIRIRQFSPDSRSVSCSKDNAPSAYIMGGYDVHLS